MKVRCERDQTEFEAVVKPYPSALHQSKNYNNGGDCFINCPTCSRAYFLHSKEHLSYPDIPDIVTGPEAKAGDFVSDRVLTIL